VVARRVVVGRTVGTALWQPNSPYSTKVEDCKEVEETIKAEKKEKAERK